MEHAGLKPNVVTYSAAISACEKGQQPEKALELLHQMQERKLVPDVVAYSAAISSCERGTKPEKALELVREMQHRQLVPEVITYSAAIGACQEWRHALDLMTEMKQQALVFAKKAISGHTR
eukprot:gnl/TRDRNA2_/TRDRNA2_173576_c1_seq18.p2 gnl/TRDRNA2_/TRDRNA2_173576_c1~~gnl/TRDRNA2_/TRDRNA2_173576_c1_seq18.p2  ORF type:complete len:121 (-),score=35.12 gnl/TRDRNA2_/TRDRNA2_173576_c1_seq18:568-930(-)